MRSIALHRDEYPSDGRVHVIRLAGTGAGEAEKGEECEVMLRTSPRRAAGRITEAETKALEELTEADARRLVGSGERALADLRTKLEQYRFRPQWEGEKTEFRILEISIESA